MSLKVLHTGDWHIGQTFYGYDRSYEHQEFLKWLVTTIKEKEIDLLIISGDVFDLSNPGAASIKLFYTFLNNVIKVRPNLQVVIIAGNHDSAARLESPKPLLESSNIHIVGMIERNHDGSIDYGKLIIPIKNNDGETKLLCMAIPFLRLGDYPLIIDSATPYSDGVAAVYKEAYEYLLTKRMKGQAIFATGHLHTLNAEISDNDKNERLIMGGIEFVPISAFNGNITYTALGHIHKAQKVGDKENIRYSGSPLPMSFSETNYKHQVIIIEVDNEKINSIESLGIPVTIKLLRIPSTPKLLTEALQELQKLPEVGDNLETSPYLEVRVLLEGPEPSLRHKIETALNNKNVRLAKIDVTYPVPPSDDIGIEVLTFDKLLELQPITVFSRIYKSRFNIEVPDELIKLFNQVSQDINAKEN